MAQAAKLQLRRAERDNRKAQGQGFFKMTEEAISTVQEDIAKDLYEMAACYQEVVELCKNSTNTMASQLSS